MTERVIGPTGSPRRRWTLLLPLVAVFAIGVLYIAGAQAVNATGAFELDGNAVSAGGDAGTGPDDWDRVCREVVGNDCSTTATTQTIAPKSTARTWIEATVTPTIFTGGGSKDPQDVSEWLWKPKDTVPDKDTLRHAFAARYSLDSSATCPGPGGNTDGTTKCEVIFFGMDRFANDGDAQLGFWFFQNPIGLTQISSQGGLKFSGVHRNGDLLLISDFSNGGTTSTISAYFWDPSCTKAANNDPQATQCAAANLRLQAKSENANCKTSSETASFCGIVNPTDGTPAPWPYLDKKGNTTYLQGEFYEGGVNLSGLGIGDECFSAVAAESRASTSPSSVLKDFVLGGFGDCTTTIATEAQFTAGTTIGGGSVSSATDKATIQVSGVQSWAGNVKFYVCGPIATGTCNANGLAVGNDVPVSNANNPVYSIAATLTAAGRYCWYAKFTPDAATAAKGVPEATDDGSGNTPNNECFTVAQVTPTLTTCSGTYSTATPPVCTPSAAVAFGSPVTDRARVAGLATEPGSVGPNATYPTINPTVPGAYAGTITFTLKARAAGGGCGSNATGTPSGGNPQNVPVDTTTGNKIYGPVSFTPDASGDYTWQATLANASSTNNTLPVSDNASCDVTNEHVTVQQTPTAIATAPFLYPQDSAKIKAASGNLPTGGSVVFKLFGPSNGTSAETNCSSGANVTTVGVGGLRYIETKTNVVTSATTNEVTAINTGNNLFSIDSSTNSTTYFWRVTYTPGATTHTGSQSVCVESTTATQVNDAYPSP